MDDLQSLYYLMAECEYLLDEFKGIIEDNFTLQKITKIFHLLQVFLEELSEPVEEDI